MADKPDATPAFRQWLRYAIYPILALLLVLSLLPVQLIDRSAPDSALGVIGVYLLVGPLLAVGLIVLAAFRFHRLHGHGGDGYLGGFPGLTVAIVGVACITVGAVLSIGAPERLSSWVIALVLEVAGVLALGAAMMIASRRREPAPDPVPAGGLASPTSPDPDLGRLEREVSESAEWWRRSSRRWGAANYLLGSLTAALSGAAGVSGVTGDPSPTESVFAILAIVGAGLAALTTSLGAAEAHKQSKMKAVALESLARQIRWRPIVQVGPPFEDYIRQFNQVTGPDWPSSGNES